LRDCKVGDVVRFHDDSLTTTGKIIAIREDMAILIRRDDGEGWEGEEFGRACWGI
jgi:hypothetical protein